MKETNEIQNNVSIPVKRYLPILFIVIIGIATSVILFITVSSWEKKSNRHEFEFLASAYTNDVEVALNEYVGALRFLGDFYNNSPLPVTRWQFTRVVKNMMFRYPGIQTFGWNPLVKDDERDLYEAAAKEDGLSDYQFTERTEKNELVRAARRDEYVVVYYMHPLENNRAAMGFDLASNKVRLEAITKAFYTGELTATGRLTLVQETGSQFGVLLLLPIYHQGFALNTPEERLKARKGFAVEVLRIGAVVEKALKGFPDEGIHLALHDMSAGEENRLLYHRPSRISEMTDQPMPVQETQKGLFWSKTFNFAERQWELNLSPSDAYFQSRKMWQAWATLSGSILLTLVLILYMLKRIRYAFEIEEWAMKKAQANEQLKNEVRDRTAAEAARDKIILNLRQAMDEVKMLRGILPLCSFCKKIRNDKGYWEQVDVYIHKHSQADISHSICPDCIKEHYPGEYKHLYPDKDTDNRNRDSE